MSQKTGITVNLQANNLGEAVGISEEGFNELQAIINETIKTEVQRAESDPEQKGINLLNIVNEFNEKLTVAQILLVTAFFTTEVLRRMETIHNSSGLEQLLAAMQEEGHEPEGKA